MFNELLCNLVWFNRMTCTVALHWISNIFLLNSWKKHLFDQWLAFIPKNRSNLSVDQMNLVTNDRRLVVSTFASQFNCAQFMTTSEFLVSRCWVCIFFVNILWVPLIRPRAKCSKQSWNNIVFFQLNNLPLVSHVWSSNGQTFCQILNYLSTSLKWL